MYAHGDQPFPSKFFQHRQRLLRLGQVVDCCVACTVQCILSRRCQLFRWYVVKRKGTAKTTWVIRSGGPQVHNHLRARAGDSADGGMVHMYRDRSIARILNQRRRLKSVLDVLQGIRSFRVLHFSWARTFSENGRKSSQVGPLGSATLEHPGLESPFSWLPIFLGHALYFLTKGSN